MQAAPGPSACGTAGSRILPEQWSPGGVGSARAATCGAGHAPDSTLQSFDFEWKRWRCPAFFGTVHIAGTAPAYPSGWSRSIE